MKLTISNLKSVLLLIAVAILFLSIKQCNTNKATAENWKGKYNYQTQVIDSFKNKKGITIIEQKVAEVNNADILKKLSAENFDLKKKNERLIKKVNAFVSTNQQVKIEDEIIPYDSTDYVMVKPDDYFYNDSLVHRDSVIIPPLKFKAEKKDYSITGAVLKTGVQIDSLTLQNTISWRIAEKKTGFFKRETYIQAINSNKYFSNTGMNSIVVKQKTTAWNKWIKPVLFLGAGVFITQKIK